MNCLLTLRRCRSRRSPSRTPTVGVFSSLLLSCLALGALSGCSESVVEPESPGTQALTSLITAEQYQNSLGYIFGPGVDLQVEFAPVARTEGLLANSASIAGVSSAQLQGIQGVAASVAKQVVDATHRNYLVPCKPAAMDEPDEDCAAEFLSREGLLNYLARLAKAPAARDRAEEKGSSQSVHFLG